VRKEQLEQLRDQVRSKLREARVGLSSAPVVRGNSVEVVVRESDLQTALPRCASCRIPSAAFWVEPASATLDISNQGGGRIQVTVTEPAIVERVRKALDQAVQIIERRINELGLVEPLIQRQGTDRILVQVPGLGDPKRLIELVGKTAKLDFRMVDETMTPEQALGSRPPPESEILYGSSREGRLPYVIENEFSSRAPISPMRNRASISAPASRW
jgi:preprotein translocase subunit SecD